MAEYETRHTPGREAPGGGAAAAVAAPKPKSGFSLFGRKKK
jgi:hypothetical protein